VQDRFVSETVSAEKLVAGSQSTRTVEAMVPTGSVAAAAPAK
jgi:hypothetical protein